MNLVIVESPTKARKLKEYLDKGYKIEASVGHVRDLPKARLGVDIDHDFEPEYEVDPEKEQIVTELRKLAKRSTTIYLAMDPDREGEAIAWHVKYLLSHQPAKSKASKSKSVASSAKPRFLRATFHEITKSAVLAAMEHPGKINLDLVDAQQARRVLDRLVGYKLSPVLWKKVRRGLSAGRVQSVALRLIAEREREIADFKPEEYWEVDVLLGLDKTAATSFKAKSPATKSNAGSNAESTETPNDKPAWLDAVPDQMLVGRVIEVNGKKYQPHREADVSGLVTGLKKADYQVQSVERKQRQRVSFPPFTTSTLQQSAATRLGFTSKQTMAIAQQLYEEGLITYHRTDSVNLSSQAINQARKYVQAEFGDLYLPASPRIFRGKSKNAQEAHEAIRVTHINLPASGIGVKSKRFGPRHTKLYDLIWRRYVASQMAAAVYDSTTILIEAGLATKSESYRTATLKSTGSILKFDGWMKLFPGNGDTIIPEVNQNQDLYFANLNAAQKFTQPPARYNDASLVKELEKRGIGRPSTYASIISVLELRGYVTRDARRFVASPVGMTVSDFLLKHFKDIMDYDFTAEMEEDLDRISRGEKEWRTIVGNFYKPLSKKIKDVSENAKRSQIPVEKTGEKCPKCGQEEKGEIVIRTGRFGKFKSCSRFPDCDFTENIVEKLGGMKCPLCHKGEVIVRPTRWGKKFFGCSRYPECDWASWGQPKPGLKLTAKEWAEIKKKRAAKSAKRKATLAKKKAGQKKPSR